MGFVFDSKLIQKSIFRLGGILGRSLGNSSRKSLTTGTTQWEELRSLDLEFSQYDIDNLLRSFFMLLDKR